MTNTSIFKAFERMWQHIVFALSDKADVADLENKQDKLAGTAGQVVGFDENGNAVAQEAPSGAVQSDWSMNDPEDPAYIKNRTHYEILPENSILLDNVTATYEPGYDMSNEEFSCWLIEGYEYKVIFDGEEYITTAYLSDWNYPIMGNQALVGFSDRGHTEPFAIGGWMTTPEESTVSIWAAEASTPHTVTLIQLTGEIVKIDKKFLPNLVGENVTGIEFDFSDIGESIIQAGEGAEVFNDYQMNRAAGSFSHAEGYETTAFGDYSHAEGRSSKALTYSSHAEGVNTTASGEGSHAEGILTIASGKYSHTEGSGTTASGNYSHAEGYDTCTKGDYSHAEGGSTHGRVGSWTYGEGAHAEGLSTIAGDWGAHSEGCETIALSQQSHAEGRDTFASGYSAHAEGEGSCVWYTVTGEANGTSYVVNTRETPKVEVGDFVVCGYRLAEITGYDAETKIFTTSQTLADYNLDEDWIHIYSKNVGATGDYSHAEGKETLAAGEAAHAEGYQTKASNAYTHAEGHKTEAYGGSSHAEGGNYSAYMSEYLEAMEIELPNGETKSITGSAAVGIQSHAEGGFTVAYGVNSHAEGEETWALSDNSHAEGFYTKAFGDNSHAEGFYTEAFGVNSHAEGEWTVASGADSHAEGYSTKASGVFSHAEGCQIIAAGKNQHAQGKYNIEDTISAHIVGNGTSSSARSNAHTLDWNGNAWFAGDVYVGSTSGKNKDEGSKKLATEEFVLENGGVQSDWNQNDIEAKDYIKNRTHYENFYDEEIIFNEIINFEEPLTDTLQFTLPINRFTEGERYVVQYQGVEYECEAKFAFGGSNWLYIGNPSIDSSSSDDTGEPFIIYTQPLGSRETWPPTILAAIDDTNILTLKIVKIKTVKQIDPKFIEDMYHVSKDKIISKCLKSDWESEALESYVYEGRNLKKTPGVSYSVIYQEQTYNFEPKLNSVNQSMIYYIGNGFLISDHLEDTGVPFVFFNYVNHDELNLILREDQVGNEIEFSLYENSYKIITIDEKYLPHRIPEFITNGLNQNGWDNRSVILNAENNDLDTGLNAYGDRSTIINGIDNKALGYQSLATGSYTIAAGSCSSSFGGKTTSYGDYSHSEGEGKKGVIKLSKTDKDKTYTVIENNFGDILPGMVLIESYYQYGQIIAYDIETNTIITDREIYGFIDNELEISIFIGAVGESSHSEGSETFAVGDVSHAEGSSTIAYGLNSHAEGLGSTATISNSHVQGKYNIIDKFSFVSNVNEEIYFSTYSYKGYDDITFNPYTGKYIGIGSYTYFYRSDGSKGINKWIINDEMNQAIKINEITNQYSYAFLANCERRTLIPDNNFAHIVGNGTSSSARSNAHTLDWDGNAWFAGDIYVGSTSGKNKDEGSKKLALVPVTRTITLTPENWTAAANDKFTQSIEVQGISADEIAQRIDVMPTAASQEAYIESVVYASAQAENSLTFTAKVQPTTNLDVFITIQELS